MGKLDRVHPLLSSAGVDDRFRSVNSEERSRSLSSNSTSYLLRLSRQLEPQSNRKTIDIDDHRGDSLHGVGFVTLRRLRVSSSSSARSRPASIVYA